jgi:hypothetical protein
MQDLVLKPFMPSDYNSEFLPHTLKYFFLNNCFFLPIALNSLIGICSIAAARPELWHVWYGRGMGWYKI